MSGVKNNVGRGINVALVNGKNNFTLQMLSVDIRVAQSKMPSIIKGSGQKVLHLRLMPFSHLPPKKNMDYTWRPGV